jgi:uncharacterized protein
MIPAMEKDTSVAQPIPVEVAAHQLEEETLTTLIEEFVLREGTDYGSVEASHEAKIAQVRKQIERRDVQIFFDPSTESVNLIRREGFR